MTSDATYAACMAAAQREYDAWLQAPVVLTVTVGEHTWTKRLAPRSAAPRHPTQQPGRRPGFKAPPCACGAEHFAKGLCRTHYWQQKNAARSDRARGGMPDRHRRRDASQRNAARTARRAAARLHRTSA